MANEDNRTPGQEDNTDSGVKEQLQDDAVIKTQDPKAADDGQGAGSHDDKGAVKGQEDGKTEDNAKAGDDKVDGKAPEAYEKFSLPEGYEYDEKLAGDFGGVAKELGLSQDKAQKLVDHYIQLTQKAIQVHNERSAQISEEWKTSAETDKEYGGAKFAENIAVAKKALESFGTPELTKHLNESGLGNHPEIIRFCWKVGKLLSDDHQPDDLSGRMKDPNKKLTEEEVAKLLFGGQKK